MPILVIFGTQSFGGMAEWLKAHAWKACLLNCNEGSNPSPSSKKPTRWLMSNHRVYLDDIYASEACKGSTFRAVVMMAQEARFINDQAREGYIQLTMKPTTIAMDKFKADKLTILTKEEAEARKLEKDAEIQKMNAEAKPVQDSASSLDAANDAFGI